MDERKRKSKKQESKVAKELSGKVTPASGALWGAKGDVRSEAFLVECKTTEKTSYRLTFNTWNKIYLEAIKDGLRIPVMCIDLKDGVYRYAVMCTKDIPHKSEFSFIKKDLWGSNRSCSILPCERRFNLFNGSKTYDLTVIEWTKFLGLVVPEYSNLKE